MYHEGVVCDACHVTIQAGAPYVTLEVKLVPKGGPSPLDRLDEPVEPVTCLACKVARTDDNEYALCEARQVAGQLPIPEEHRWSDDVVPTGRRKRRRGRVMDGVDYCMSCFRERSIEHVQKLVALAAESG